MVKLFVIGFLPIVSGHGAMYKPKAWNAEDISGTIPMAAVFSATDNGYSETSWAINNCTGPEIPARTDLPVGQCLAVDDRVFKGQYLTVTSTPPSTADNLLDCTSTDNCIDPAVATLVGDPEVSQAWVTKYAFGDNECRSTPVVSYRVNLGSCTKFPTYVEHSDGSAWFSQGCAIGCAECTGIVDAGCDSPMQPTLNDPDLRTMNVHTVGGSSDWSASHPWRAPGHAPVMDSCGMAGGSFWDNQAAGGYVPPGHKLGDRGSELPPLQEKKVWKAGTNVEVLWYIVANHGGGYQYRLCPKGEPLTEECFMKVPLPFASTTQKLIWDSEKEVEINGTFVSTGTLPAGSTWVKNPIPPCNPDGGPGPEAAGYMGVGCDRPQFPPPPACGEHCWAYHSDEYFTLPGVQDVLALPADLPAGDYILGWRWDCEHTTQIWASCTEIAITNEEDLSV